MPRQTNRLWWSALIPALFCMSAFIGSERQTKSRQLPAADTTIPVYGPYRVVKLPITKGVNILNPIQVAAGPGGLLYAANQSGEVYTLRDTNGDGLEDEARIYCNVSRYNLRSPTGFTHRGDTVYIGTAQQIRAFLDRDRDGSADTSWAFFSDIPYSQHPYEWTTALTFGPDGWLYFALITDSWNAGPSPDPKKYRGAILRVSPDGSKAETVVTGIRSVYGMAFHPNGDLFFTDNAGGGNPREELNRVVPGGFYGHNAGKYAGQGPALPPDHELETEIAPSGIVFNNSKNDFGGTAGNLFVAFYGPGERWQRGGVGHVKMVREANGKYRYQEQPVADIPKLSALAFGKDGALYVAHHGVADYWYNSTQPSSGGFYKIVYDPSATYKAAASRALNTGGATDRSIAVGKQLFAERACAGCHAVQGGNELLGPTLTGIGKALSRQELLEEITQPSKIIKPSMAAVRITKTDGQVLLGRVVQSDTRQVSLMLVGNKVVRIPRSEISSTTTDMKSLMYQGLLNGMRPEEVESLLDYIVSLK